MTIEDLVNKYLLTEADVDCSSVLPFVVTFENSRAASLVERDRYFAELCDAIVARNAKEWEQSIYVASWNFTRNFEFVISDRIHLTCLVNLFACRANLGAIRRYRSRSRPFTALAWRLP